MIYEKPKNEIFASDAKDGEIVEFPNVKRGWGVTENLGFIPPMEYFNAAFNRVDKSLAYQLQRGVGEWDKDLEYPIGAVVSLNGVVYVAKSQNTNKNPANEATIWDIVATQKWCEAVFALKNELTDGLPIGAYLSYPSQKTIPAGFLIADGRSLKKSEYTELFDVIGYTYGGSGDNFNLPNFADGKFMRGIGGNAAALGTAQGDAIRNITGSLPPYDAGALPTNIERGAFKTVAGGGAIPTGTQGVRAYQIFDASYVVPTANENRPLNMAVVVIIKAKNVNTPIAGQIDKTIFATEAKPGIVKLKNAITAKQEDAAVTEKAVSDFVEQHTPPSIGVDQTWQDVKRDRKQGVIYTNATGRAIIINVAGAITTNSSEDVQLFINNVLTQKINIGSKSGYICAVVPAGSTYKVTTSANSQINPSSFVWVELR
ncbi:phage tail protein [Campylobacter concisus]|uniref:phage tail protein n=1 Tax=Campylobacter concisus TaxID=199 RepID=UPI000CD7ECD8|nr:tail fiber protein [Campylobacter concisus]